MTVTATENKVTYDLNTAKGRKELKALIDSEEESPVNYFSSIEDYLRHGQEPSLHVGDTLIFGNEYNDYSLLLVNNRVIYYTNGGHGDQGDGAEYAIKALDQANENIGKLRNPSKHLAAVGLIIEKPITIGDTEYQYTVLRRGDEEHNILVDALDNGFPTISFSAIAQMLHDDDEASSVSAVVKSFVDGDLKLVDFIPDEHIDLTSEENAELRKAMKLKDPTKRMQAMPVGKPGFSIVGTQWHRSSTILFRDSEWSYLFGQDEDTYFGTKLADNPKTVTAAFESLMPPQVRGKNFQRQGEWFLLPIDESEVPSLEESLIGKDYSINLPVTDINSNNHVVSVHNEGDIRIAKNGQIFACTGYVEHDEHDTVYFDGWVTFYRNTALKSVSAQNNVD